MGNVPKLRFPQFSGDWEVTTIGTLSKIKTGNKDTQDKIENGEYPFFVRSNTIERINSYSFDGEAILTAGDGVGVGKVFHYLNEKFDYHQRVYNIHNFIDSVIGKYIFFYFSNRFYKRVIKLSAKNSVDSVRMDMISKMPIPLPQKQEQEKIASFLSSVDKKIEKLEEKVALQEKYKKAMMQKLFSQEIRFKADDSSAFPDWEEKKYNEIYSFYSTNSLSRDKLNYEKGNVKNIHYGDIHTKFKTIFDIENENVPFVNLELDISKIKEESYCLLGDLIIADASEDYKDIGKTIELINLNNEKLIAGLHTFLARPNKYDMALGFAGYLLQSWKIRKQVMTISQGTKVLSLSTSRLGNIKLDIPSKEEQQKIANFLSSLDKKIEATKKQKQKAQEFKKGLLQQMFV